MSYFWKVGVVTIPVYNMRKDSDYTLFSLYKKAIKVVGFKVYFTIKVVYICQLYTFQTGAKWCDAEPYVYPELTPSPSIHV